MRTHHIPSRAHLQGNPAPLRLRHSARKLTDGAGLVQLRRPWGRWELGTLAYQMLHGVRTLALSGPWRVAQPDRLRNWLFRLPGRGEVRLPPDRPVQDP